jgi:hypothetical protein
MNVRVAHTKEALRTLRNHKDRGLLLWIFGYLNSPCLETLEYQANYLGKYKLR